MFFYQTALFRVAEAIVGLQVYYIGWPTEEADRLRLMRKFYAIKEFPNVCGAIDGTHVDILPPKADENWFVNRHGNHSLNVCAVAGSNYAFHYVNARHAGRAHDSGVMLYTGLMTTFETNGYRPFPGAVLLGDSAYPLKEWLMTPFRSTTEMTPAMRRYQTAHSLTRGVVEKAFGILKMRFRGLHSGLRVASVIKANRIIMAACILHNMCIQEGDDIRDLLQDFEDEHFRRPQFRMSTVSPTASAKEVRNKFVENFARGSVQDEN